MKESRRSNFEIELLLAAAVLREFCCVKDCFEGI